MRRMSIEKKRRLHGLLFMSPWIIGLLLFWLYPLVYSLVMSLNKIVIQAEDLVWTFIGFANYNDIMLKDTGFWDQWIPFFMKSVFMIPIIILFSIISALFLNQKFPGRGLFRAVFFLPVLFTTGGVIISLLTANSGGGVGAVGTTNTLTLEFLQDQNLRAFIQTNFDARLSNTIIDILNSFVIILWYSGVQTVLLLAGLQSISPSVYEAATIDGANGWERLWKITLPGLVPFILIVAVYSVVDQFTMPSNPMMGLISRNMYETTRGMGYASAMGWIYVAFIMFLLAIIFLVFRKAFVQKVR
ncbi:carbohydrate ABC transporter permease [Paenibacillus spongiae]|uniref:Sugar ABC transporter permease n=1 Tax=Paenibacillus spongiae TaxID=2909671 RepID=A0ABY5S7G2_9BACL|nr:sugar ABC transporter permease [Paenibacillus spongiae]UVI29525.1 sugar ABC transporter permease [Paenibacillus spongiae]